MSPFLFVFIFSCIISSSSVRHPSSSSGHLLCGVFPSGLFFTFLFFIRTSFPLFVLLSSSSIALPFFPLHSLAFFSLSLLSLFLLSLVIFDGFDLSRLFCSLSSSPILSHHRSSISSITLTFLLFLLMNWSFCVQQPASQLIFHRFV